MNHLIIRNLDLIKIQILLTFSLTKYSPTYLDYLEMNFHFSKISIHYFILILFCFFILFHLHCFDLF